LSYGCTRYCRPRPSCGTGILGHDALERNPLPSQGVERPGRGGDSRRARQLCSLCKKTHLAERSPRLIGGLPRPAKASALHEGLRGLRKGFRDSQ